MSATQRPVLVTGAWGNVGRHTVRALLVAGHRVVACDLENPRTRKAADELDGRLEVRWVDLTGAGAVEALVAGVRPRAVLHLAAVIPPATYAVPAVARTVNVGVTTRIVEAVGLLADPCRLVFASSVAVYGSRNPHTMRAPVTAEDPVRPVEVYGAHKVECERLIRASGLDWAILRIGVAVFPDMSLTMDAGSLRLEGLLPVDGRLHAVDGRDVGTAFAAAVDAPCSGRTLLVAGDSSTRMTQGELSRSVLRAVGLPHAMPPGRTGDPTDDDAWFTVDWMDTGEALELLDFQRHPWSVTLDDLSRLTGPARRFLPVLSPAARLYFSLRSPYRGQPPGPADVWGGVAREWGVGALAGPERPLTG